MSRTLVLTLYLLLSTTIAQSHTIGIIADFNGRYGSTSYDPLVHKAVKTMIDDWQVDLVLMPGDVIAGQSHSLAEDSFADMWQGFDEAITTPLRDAGVPYVFSVGNHDGSSQRSSSNFSYTRERTATKTYWSKNFSQLSYVETSNYPFQYSMVFKDLFVISLDASSNRLLDDTERWLEEQLKSPLATQANYRIVIGHLPLYGVAQGKTKAGEVLANSTKLQNLFQINNVDMYISGHHAAYYPAINQDLVLIHAGGIMGRKLLASDEAAIHTVVRLSIDENKGLSVDAYNLKSESFVDVNTLPVQIDGVNGSSYLLK